MKKIYKITTILFLSILFFNSCNDIIELDLKNTEPRIVIEANLNMSDSTFVVNITKSNGFYDETEYEKIKDAKIILKNSNGTTYTIPEIEDGKYRLNDVVANTNDAFSLSIEKDGKEYKAETICPYAIDLARVIPAPFTPPGGGPPNNNTNENILQIMSFWKDSVNIDNYYRIKTYINDTLQAANYELADDRYFNGDTIVSVSILGLESGDKLKMELLSTDQKYFDYFVDIAILYSRGPGGTTPYNPKGNFNNGALGYFGIYSTSGFEFTLP